MSARFSAVQVSLQGMKWRIFVNRQTTTSIALNPFDQGSLMMKSIEMCFQAPSGIGSGCRIPKGAWREVLEC